MRTLSKTHAAGLLITGAGIGALAALLFAPKTGIQTRKEIRRFSKRTVDQLADQIDDLRSNIQEQINESYVQVKKMLKTA